MATRTVITILVAVVLVIGGTTFYVINLRGDLDAARIQAEILSNETARLRAEITKKSVPVSPPTDDEKKSEVITEELTLLKQELVGANARISALESDLHRAEENADNARTVAEQWRDLFDYSRARNSRAITTARGSGASGSSTPGGVAKPPAV